MFTQFCSKTRGISLNYCDVLRLADDTNQTSPSLLGCQHLVIRRWNPAANEELGPGIRGRAPPLKDFTEELHGAAASLTKQD